MTRPRLADEPDPRPVLAGEEVFDGAVWSVHRDEVDLGAAGTVVRDYVVHPGAVAVLALDDDDRAVLVRQYRHPVRAMCWELPAGLRDVPDEPAVDTARRELVEETGHRAERWFRLVEVDTTPGGSSEHLTVLLARGITAVPDRDGFRAEGEELGMEVAWFPLDEVVEAVLAGRVGNPSLVSGVLAAAVLRERGWAGLREIQAL